MCVCVYLFRATPAAYGGSRARQGSNRSCSCRPTPQPQQRGISATPATYTTAHGNIGSFTHWARPGIKPASSGYQSGSLPLSHDGNSNGETANASPFLALRKKARMSALRASIQHCAELPDSVRKHEAVKEEEANRPDSQVA